MKSILNKGLNENLKVHFSEVTVQVKNPLVESPPPPLLDPSDGGVVTPPPTEESLLKESIVKSI